MGLKVRNTILIFINILFHRESQYFVNNTSTALCSCVLQCGVFAVKRFYGAAAKGKVASVFQWHMAAGKCGGKVLKYSL
jgi:hypothetical protein